MGTRTRKPKLNVVSRISAQIFLLGTSHLDATSPQQVAESIHALRPNVVMIELDAEEYRELFDTPTQNAGKSAKINPSDNRQDSDILELISHTQQAFGELLHITPGAELLEAVQTAKKLGSKVEFIDLPFRITFQKIHDLQTVHQKEKDQLAERFQEETLNTEEMQNFFTEMHDADFLAEMLHELKKQYPELYQILFSDRNDYMAEKIWQYHVQHPIEVILIVVGAGHMHDLIAILDQKIATSKSQS